MNATTRLAAACLVGGLALAPRAGSGQAPPREVSIAAPNGLMVKVKAEGPSGAEVPLQVVCLFKHKAAGDHLLGAAVELDGKLGGALTALRDRGEFVGDALETLVLMPPPGTIKAGRLLLIGLGEEQALSLDGLEGVGRVAAREASRLGATRVAFAPLIRDQGNSRFNAGDVAHAVARGVLLALDTERRLQGQGLAPKFTVESWEQEAGLTYFDDTVAGVRKAGAEAARTIGGRSARPFAGAQP